MKEHEVREYINRLSSIAKTYSNHQSLRERMAHEVLWLIEDVVKRHIKLYEPSEEDTHKQKVDLLQRRMLLYFLNKQGSKGTLRLNDLLDMRSRVIKFEVSEQEIRWEIEHQH